MLALHFVGLEALRISSTATNVASLFFFVDVLVLDVPGILIMIFYLLCKSECCYSVVLRSSHPCVERAMHQDCPVCFEVLPR